MSLMQVIFILTALVTLVSAVLVVSVRKMMHAALWLIVSLFGVAVAFVLLEAAFFAMVQVIVYIGAIAILVVFAVMLTRRIMEDSGPQVNRGWPWAAATSAALFAGLVWLLSAWKGFGAAALPLAQGFDPVKPLGVMLVSAEGAVAPFEAASVLLLAALVGAIYIGLDRK